MLKPLRGKLVLAILMGAIKATLSVAVLVFISHFSEPGFAERENIFLFLTLFIIVTFLTGTAANLVLVGLSSQISYELRRTLGEKVLKAKFSDIEKVGDTRIKVILSHDTVSLTEAISILPDLVFVNCFILFSFSYLAYIDLYLFAVLVACLVIGIGIIAVLVRLMHYFDNSTRNLLDDYQNHVEYISMGMKEMALSKHRRRFFLLSLFSPTLSKLKDAESRRNMLGYLGNNASEAVVLFSLTALLFVAFRLHTESLAVLANFLLIVLFIRGPISALLGAAPVLSKGRIAASKMAEIMDLTSYEQLKETTTETSSVGSQIELDQVTFSYPKADDARPFGVGPISLRLRSGEINFIIGGNGSGKSTLLKVLCGLYFPTSGTIRVNTISSEDELYPEHFSAIFSDYYLMPHVIDNEGNAITQSIAADLLNTLHLSNKTRIENGLLSNIKLSQGQKKRLALLISIFENKPVVVLDEWAADQDPYFKEVFYCHILPELKAQNKIVIIVSHDEKYFGCADRIFKLSDGQMKEFLPNEFTHDTTIHHIGSISKRTEKNATKI